MADNNTTITPEDVKKLLTEFVSRERQTYVGMRYVPKFADPIEWDPDTEYEPLTMVTHNDGIYVSKFYVPADVDISETEYWALWGEIADGTIGFDTLTDELRSAWVRTFDTVSDMQAATDLLAGMTCHTNGFQSSGDGCGAYYTVGASGDVALQGGLYASKVAYKAPVPSSPKILAHRGISTTSSWIYSIDNSLWSFMGAMANGFDGFECDVRKDVNGVLVTIHDADVSSVSNSSGNIDTLDYSTVKYATRKTAVTTDTTLTTLAEAAQVAKAFNAFMFVNVKDTTISAQQVVTALLAQGLDYDNFGVFIDTDNSSWVTSALSVQHANIGYSTTNYTATAAEMAQLKTMADTAGKPYDEIIVRCNYSQQLANIKYVGFKSCLDDLTHENSMDCQMVDYSIDSGRRWNGEDDANANLKGRSIRGLSTQLAQYETLQSYLADGISDAMNHFFARANGATLKKWFDALGLTAITPSVSNGGTVMGITTGDFVTGLITPFRTTNLYAFSYEKSNQSLQINPLYNMHDITQAALDAMRTAAQGGKYSSYSGYATSANSDAILGITGTSGCNVTVTTTVTVQTAIFVPVNTSLKTIYVYKRNLAASTPTIYTITGA